MNKSDFAPDGLLWLLRERLAKYRSAPDRERLLSGIKRDPTRGQLSVRDAVVFIFTIASLREWRSSEARISMYNYARQLSRYDFDDIKHHRSGVAPARALLGERSAGRIEALTALGFARHCGYPNHSLKLWRCIEKAICTDGLGNAPRVVKERGDVDDYYQTIRLRLIYQYKKYGTRALRAEAEGLFSELTKAVTAKEVVKPIDRLILNAKHRDM